MAAPPAQVLLQIPQGAASTGSSVERRAASQVPPQKQTTVVNMPILTKYVNQPENSSRHTQLSDIITGV